MILCDSLYFLPTEKVSRLDDIQDGSALRRGRPAAHKVFGEGQTMNSAFFYIVRAVEEAAAFNEAEGPAIVIGAFSDPLGGEMPLTVDQMKSNAAL